MRLFLVISPLRRHIATYPHSITTIQNKSPSISRIVYGPLCYRTSGLRSAIRRDQRFSGHTLCLITYRRPRSVSKSFKIVENSAG